jgi:hypothetical protein
MADEYLDMIRKLTFNALGHDATVEEVAFAMAQGVSTYLNKIAEIEDRLPSFTPKQIEESSIYSDGSK